VIDADPLRLRQALVNLVDNALRHSPRGGTIRIAARATSDATMITVADDGPGFQRTADSDHGLGLRIVRAVADGHGGTLRIRTADHGGAVAELTVLRRRDAGRIGRATIEGDRDADPRTRAGDMSQ
jgi:signal transduction histidine kinase